MATWPWDVSEPGRKLAWAWLLVLLSGFLVYCSFLTYKAHTLSEAPLVSIRYDVKDHLQLPYVAVCISDEDPQVLAGTVISGEQYARCVVTGAESGPSQVGGAGTAANLPRAGRSVEVNTQNTCAKDYSQDEVTGMIVGPVSMHYQHDASCQVEIFRFYNRLGWCAECFGFPLSDYKINQQNGSASIYIGLRTSDGAPATSECEEKLCGNAPISVYLIEPGDVPLVRANNFSQVIETTTSFAVQLRSTRRIVLQNQVTKKYRGALSSRVSASHFKQPITKELPVGAFTNYEIYTKPSDYVALNFTTASAGTEMIDQLNPWLALPSSIGGAWSILVFAFAIVFTAINKEPTVTWRKLPSLPSCCQCTTGKKGTKANVDIPKMLAPINLKGYPDDLEAPS